MAGEIKMALYGFKTANVAANREGNPRESKSPLPRFLALWTNSKKPRYKGKCSWEIPRCGRSQERSKDQNPSIWLPFVPRNDVNFIALDNTLETRCRLVFDNAVSALKGHRLHIIFVEV